jgi:putative Holliday junction resolvase
MAANFPIPDLGFNGRVEVMKVIAVDPGSKRIGLAISDPTGVIANPLAVLEHVSRLVDAASVAETAAAQGAGLIVIGQSFDEAGNLSFEGRRGKRFAEALKTQTVIPIVLWDEAFTTQDARAARIEMGARRKGRSGHLDDLAATVLLQSYLDANPQDFSQSRVTKYQP